MADGSLFRPKAMEAKSDNNLGEITIAQPMGMWLLAGIAFTILTVAALFLVFGEYTRKSAVTGRLVPTDGLSTLTAPGNGNVAKLFVQEGDAVEAGDPLILIESDRNLADGRDANAALLQGVANKQRGLDAELREQDALMHTQRIGLKAQLNATELELLNLVDELDIRRNQVRLGQDSLLRFQSLLEQKYVSQIQVTQQEQALLEQRANVESMERQVATLQRNLTQIRQSINELPARSQLLHAQAQREMAGLEQERISSTANATTLIKARTDGTISNKLVELGQAVTAGQSILTILPKTSSLQAQLLVPSSAVGLIKRGDEVILRYRAFPYQKFGHQKGMVTEVAKSALTPRELTGIVGESPTQESFYRVIVKLENQTINALGRQYPLRPGMDVDARIIGESRKLWKWIFDLQRYGISKSN